MIGDINKRKGIILNSETEDGAVTIRAEVCACYLKKNCFTSNQPDQNVVTYDLFSRLFVL